MKIRDRIVELHRPQAIASAATISSGGWGWRPIGPSFNARGCVFLTAKSLVTGFRAASMIATATPDEVTKCRMRDASDDLAEFVA